MTTQPSTPSWIYLRPHSQCRVFVPGATTGLKWRGPGKAQTQWVSHFNEQKGPLFELDGEGWYWFGLIKDACRNVPSMLPNFEYYDPTDSIPQVMCYDQATVYLLNHSAKSATNTF